MGDLVGTVATQGCTSLNTTAYTLPGPENDWVSYCSLSNLASPVYTMPSNQYLTVCFWSKLASAPGGTFLRVSINGINQDFLSSTTGNNILRLQFIDGTLVDVGYYYPLPGSNQWHFSCAVWSNSRQNLLLYLDGQTSPTINWISNAINKYAAATVQITTYNIAYMDEIRVFNTSILPSEVQALYEYRGPELNPVLSFIMSCPLLFQCNLPRIYTQCTYCTPNNFVGTNLINYCATLPTATNVQMCMPCISPSQVPSGFYLTSFCTGHESQSNTYARCDLSTLCPTGFYKQQCTPSQNSLCTLSFTQCPVNQFLTGYSSFNDGTCQPCSDCGIGMFLSNCSQYKDSVCNNACTSSATCGQQVCVKWSFNRQTCGTCPIGFSYQSGYCIACPPGHICDKNGKVLCKGSCPSTSQPVCWNGINGLVTCLANWCSSYTAGYTNSYMSQVTNGIWTGSFVQSMCVPAFQCNAGYYPDFFLQNQNGVNYPMPKCSPCSNTGNLYALTSGLTPLNSYSCLFLSGSYTYAGNAIGRFSSQNLLCPASYTSQKDLTATNAQCVPCPQLASYQGMTWTDPSRCKWQCTAGYYQRDNECWGSTDLTFCSAPGVYKTYSNTLGAYSCTFTTFPFQPMGNSPGSTLTALHSTFTDMINSSNGIYVNGPNTFLGITQYDTNTLYSTQAFTVTYYTQLNYLGVTQYFMNVFVNATQIVRIALVYAQPLSCTIDLVNGVYYVYYTIVGYPYILYFPINYNYFPISQTLIGETQPGYYEGMSGEALFQTELYVAVLSYNSKIMVLDTLNCVFRTIVLGPNGPGDFRTTSYLAYGLIVNAQPWCSGNLQNATRMYPLGSPSSPLYLAFENMYQGRLSLCLYSVLARDISCPPELAFDNTYDLQSVYVSSDYLTLTLQYSYYNQGFQRAGSPCLTDYTNTFQGTDCALYRPWNGGQGYYIQQGIAYQCLQLSCPPGQYFQPCTRTQQAACVACTPPVGVAYKFTKAGSCDYNLVAPCPQNMYLDSVSKVCLNCPPLMYTLAANTSSIDGCLCPAPLVRMSLASGPDCVVQDPLYPIPTADRCGSVFAYYNFYCGNCPSCTQYMSQSITTVEIWKSYSFCGSTDYIYVHLCTQTSDYLLQNNQVLLNAKYFEDQAYTALEFDDKNCAVVCIEGTIPLTPYRCIIQV